MGLCCQHTQKLTETKPLDKGSTYAKRHQYLLVFMAKDATSCLYLQNKKAVFAWKCLQTITFTVYTVKQAAGAEQDSNILTLLFQSFAVHFSSTMSEFRAALESAPI